MGSVGFVLNTMMGRQHCIHNNVKWHVLCGMGFDRTELVKVLFTDWGVMLHPPNCDEMQRCSNTLRWVEMNDDNKITNESIC